MNRLFIILFVIFLTSLPSIAQDFLVEVIEENYKETQAPFSYDPLIYHSMQINCAAGPKVVVITGKDYVYRKWLRQYMSQGHQFIIKVPQDKTDQFISAKVFKTDLSTLHPFMADQWKVDVPKTDAASKGPLLSGRNFLLTVDADETRAALFKTVAAKMGYQAVSFKSTQQALSVFRLQPEKFRLIAVDYQSQGMPAQDFIEKIVSIKHNIPILLDTGYADSKSLAFYKARFSKLDSVYVKPVVLSGLEQTIKSLLKSGV